MVSRSLGLGFAFCIAFWKFSKLFSYLFLSYDTFDFDSSGLCCGRNGVGRESFLMFIDLLTVSNCLDGLGVSELFCDKSNFKVLGSLYFLPFPVGSIDLFLLGLKVFKVPFDVILLSVILLADIRDSEILFWICLISFNSSLISLSYYSTF